jgi:putative tryptophan/tyrosine transport system substrate-binding protein
VFSGETPQAAGIDDDRHNGRARRSGATEGDAGHRLPEYLLGPQTLASWAVAFRQGLSETGHVEGQNFAIEYRWADGDYDRLPQLAADLVRSKVDLIATFGGTSAALAAKRATSTIPIVFTNVGDPVGSGLVASLARPAGNLTGFSNMSLELTPKRLELLCELVPQARVIALLVNPTNKAFTEPMVSAAREAAQTRALQLSIVQASSKSEIDAAFATIAQLHAAGLVVAADPFFNSQREQVVGLAAGRSVPAIYERREYAAAGGLISYGPSLAVLTELDHQAGLYAGKILAGAKPADLPVIQPDKFELVINLKTAKALGLPVSPSMLDLADEVIE